MMRLHQMFAAATAARADSAAPVSAAPPPPSGDGIFDPYYAGSFTLPLNDTSTRTYSLPTEPANKASNFATPSGTDANTSAQYFRITKLSVDNQGGYSRVRHDYSKRDPFNASGGTRRIIIQRGDGGLSAHTIPTASTGPAAFVKDLPAGDSNDCNWDATDPDKLNYCSTFDGGMLFYEYDFGTNASTLIADFRNRLPAAIVALGASQTTSRLTTKGEGRPSFDGRYWCLNVQTDSFQPKGTICYDRQTDTIVGYVASTTYAYSSTMSGLGGYMEMEYAGGGNHRAFPRTYQGDGTTGSVACGQGHGDVCVAHNGQEVFACFDYDATNYIKFWPLDGSTAYTSSPLFYLYPVSGEATAGHISGVISRGKPGWIIVSTYSSYSDYGATEPAPTARYLYDRIFAIEIKAGGRVILIGDHHSRRYGSDSSLTYFAEPQATSDPTGELICFASNWIGRTGTTQHVEPSCYVYGLPSWAIPEAT